MQGVRVKRIVNANHSVVDIAEAVGSRLYKGLKLFVRGNEWCPGWREPVAFFFFFFFVVSCSSYLECS